MRRKSLLIAAVGKMMKQDEWQRKYDPNQMFNIVPYDYNTQRDYLNALREAWQWELDPGQEYCKYVNVNNYDDYDNYEYAIEKYKEKVEEKEEWYDEYDPLHCFNANPFHYSSERAYLQALRKEWKQTLDPHNKYSNIDVNMYYSFEDYEEDILLSDDEEI